ncbi:MAG: DUF58 domain-containing protein [Chloroflexota bacterium]
MNAGRGLVLLLVFVGAAGAAISGAAFYSHLLYLGLILAATSWLSVRMVARALRMTRRPDFYRASVGDIFKEQFEIVNMSRVPGGWVELHNEMPLPAASGSRLLTRLGPRQKQTFVARTWLTRRGGFAVGPTRLVVADALGLFRVERRIPAERTLVVLPMVFPVSDFLQPPGLLPGGKVIQRRSLDITPHASGVRPYVPGDPMRRIHWPTTARRGQLIVKEFEQDPQAEVWIFLDAQKKVQAQAAYETPAMPLESMLFTRKPKLTLPPSTLEYAISIAASLAHYFIAQKRSVGLVARDRGHAMIPAERSQRQETKILETLAFLEGNGDQSISALVSAHAPLLPKGSSVLLLTPTMSDDLVMVTDDLRRRRLRPIVILMAAQTFGGQPGTERVADALRAQGVPLQLIECGADLADALSGFAASYASQDGTRWHRPALSHLT